MILPGFHCPHHGYSPGPASHCPICAQLTELNEVAELQTTAFNPQIVCGRPNDECRKIRAENALLRAVAESALYIFELDRPLSHDSECPWIISRTEKRQLDCICGAHKFKEALKAWRGKK